MTSERGFTLLEMLVVLLIAGIALALASQALGQYQRAHTRVIASERAGREIRLSEAWFRAAVRGLVTTETGTGGEALPLRSDDAALSGFEGSKDGFTGTTLSPVLGGQGIPVSQAWRVIRDAAGNPRLQVTERDEALVLSLPPAVDLRLHYLGPAGEVHDRWPPAQGTSAQLPEAVVLELVPESGERGELVTAAVLGPRDPLEHPVEYAREP